MLWLQDIVGLRGDVVCGYVCDGMTMNSLCFHATFSDWPTGLVCWYHAYQVPLPMLYILQALKNSSKLPIVALWIVWFPSVVIVEDGYN